VEVAGDHPGHDRPAGEVDDPIPGTRLDLARPHRGDPGPLDDDMSAGLRRVLPVDQIGVRQDQSLRHPVIAFVAVSLE
jgi:hypothetical protein